MYTRTHAYTHARARARTHTHTHTIHRAKNRTMIYDISKLIKHAINDK